MPDLRKAKARAQERQKYHCASCGHRHILTLHHKKARVEGGPDKEWNVVGLCRACHDELHAMGKGCKDGPMDIDGAMLAMQAHFDMFWEKYERGFGPPEAIEYRKREEQKRNMAKLHELLAVNDNVRGQTEACRADLRNTFTKKENHFKKRVVTVKSKKEGEGDKQDEQLALQTTVAKELDWIGEKIAKSLDVAFQIDVANTIAKADVVLDDAKGTVLLKGLPTTQLLQLEKRIAEIQELVQDIPTLDPSKGFVPDPAQGDNIYKARDDERPRTEKAWSFTVMVPPTDKHPAMVKEHSTDTVVGSTVTQEWSSMLTVAAKGDMLDRLESLKRAVKKARARANEQDIDVSQNKIGATILDFVFKAKIA